MNNKMFGLLIVLFATACGSGETIVDETVEPRTEVETDQFPCVVLMQDAFIRHESAPEEVMVFENENVTQQTWWYWSMGVSYKFTWGLSITGCEQTVFEFPAII